MELVYLWVEDYKNIHRQGFNFSPRFTCDYNDETNKLTIDKNDDYIENFFGDNINVTAIVGKNGSGKSNILEILFYKTKHRNKNKITFFIILFENKYYLYLFKSGELVLKKEINLDSSLDIKLIEDEIDVKNNNTKIEYDYLSIFYSNLPSEMPPSYNNTEDSFINISTSHLTQKNGSQSFSIKNVLDMLKSTNIDLPFNIPNNLLIDLNSTYYNDENNAISQKIRKLEHTLNDSSNTFFYNSLIAELIYRYYDVMNITEKDIKGVSTFDELHKLFIESSINNIYPQLYELTEKIRSLSIDNVTMKLSIKSEKDFINKIVETINLLEGVLRLRFDIKMSTGEEAFLFQFANIYDSLTRKHIKGWFNIYSSDHIVLLIDEGETTLHPQWQKEYLSYLVYFLSKNFSDRKFHLILTSHSPFLLSDIPKQNIIFLDKNEDGTCKVVNGLNDKKQTFGANIHTLLSDSFFMDDGLMGEFAKGKIDKAITLLNKDKLDEKELKYCEQIISIIGEPIVKNQLQRMLDSKRLSKIDDINAKIKQMSYELGVLKEHQSQIVQDELRDKGKQRYKERFIDDKNN